MMICSFATGSTMYDGVQTQFGMLTILGVIVNKVWKGICERVCFDLVLSVLTNCFDFILLLTIFGVASEIIISFPNITLPLSFVMTKCDIDFDIAQH